jgi:hypothetical protein
MACAEIWQYTNSFTSTGSAIFRNLIGLATSAAASWKLIAALIVI